MYTNQLNQEKVSDMPVVPILQYMRDQLHGQNVDTQDALNRLRDHLRVMLLFPPEVGTEVKKAVESPGDLLGEIQGLIDHRYSLHSEFNSLLAHLCKIV